MTTPDRIAMCTHPNGEYLHIPLRSDEPMPTTCFQDCDCTPAEFVRVASPRKDEADPVVAGLREKAESVAERNQRIIEAELSGRCGSLPPVHGKEGQR